MVLNVMRMVNTMSHSRLLILCIFLYTAACCDYAKRSGSTDEIGLEEIDCIVSGKVKYGNEHLDTLAENLNKQTPYYLKVMKAYAEIRKIYIEIVAILKSNNDYNPDKETINALLSFDENIRKCRSIKDEYDKLFDERINDAINALKRSASEDTNGLEPGSDVEKEVKDDLRKFIEEDKKAEKEWNKKETELDESMKYIRNLLK
jgi:hypothetical protein